MTPIQEYVKNNYSSLPKSSFDGQPCVIVKQITNDDYGYGHHIYEGIGVTEDGKIIWAYSSGCSCEGSVSTTPHSDEKTVKVLGADFDLSALDPAEVDFEELCVTMSSY